MLSPLMDFSIHKGEECNCVALLKNLYRLIKNFWRNNEK